MKQAIDTHRRMTETPVLPLILRLAVPGTLAMLFNSVYGLADAWFLSRLGTEASGAVGVVFSITALIQAIGFTLGNGAGSLLSRALGAKNARLASSLAAIAFWLSLSIGLSIALLGCLFLSPIVRFLGATEGIYPYAAPYAFFLFCAAPSMCASFVLNNLLRSEGKVVWSMVGFAVGNLLNILLDPIFIFALKLGCAGAALATLISQSAALLTMLTAYVFKKSALSLRPLNAIHALTQLPSILQTGLPSLLRQGLSGVASILLTRQAALWGDAAVAGVSAVSRVFLLLYSFCLGIGQGMMPAAGYNKGAGKERRAIALYRDAMVLATIVMLVLTIPTSLFAPRILAFFRPDADVVAVGTSTLRAICAILPFHGVIAVTNMFLQAVGKKLGASLIAAARQGIFFLPFIYLLPSLYGLEGLTGTQALADLFTFFLTIPFVVHIFCNGLEANKHRRPIPLREFLHRSI